MARVNDCSEGWKAREDAQGEGDRKSPWQQEQEATEQIQKGEGQNYFSSTC